MGGGRRAERRRGGDGDLQGPTTGGRPASADSSSTVKNSCTCHQYQQKSAASSRPNQLGQRQMGALYNTNNRSTTMLEQEGIQETNNNICLKRGKTFSRPGAPPGVRHLSSGSGDPGGGWRGWGYGLVALLAVLAYTNSLGGGLVHDDVLAVTNNKDVHVNVTDVTSLLYNDFWGKPMSEDTSHKSYRPLCVLSFRLNFLLGGLDPWGYHLTNVLLHAACSALFLAFCQRHVFRFRWALLGAAMFAVHPIHTEAVAGVVGRADVLVCLLFLSSLMAYISSLETRRHSSEVAGTACTRQFVVCLLTGSAAMFVKETGVTVFGVCLLYDVTVASRNGLKRYLESRSLDKRCLPLVKRVAVILALVSLLLCLRLKLMGGTMPPFTDQDNPAAFSTSLTTRVLTRCYLYALNAYLLAYPGTLSYDWQMGTVPLVESLGDKRNLLSLTFLVSLTGIFYMAVTKAKGLGQRRLVLGVGLLIIPFLPATSLFFTVGFVLAERVLYMPSMGYIILVVEGLQRLAGPCRSGPPWRWGRREAGVVYTALLLGALWTGRTLVRNQVWHSRVTLFRSGLETFPHNAKMHYNYANLLKDTGQREAAVKHYQQAIRLWPTYGSAHNNLGTLLEDAAHAEQHYLEAIRIHPQHAGAYFNLGNLLVAEGRKEEGVAAFEKSVAIDNKNADSHTSLASVLADLGRHLEAEKHYTRAVELDPGGADYENNYGVFLSQRGRPLEALGRYELALLQDPLHHVAMLNAARTLRQVGRMAEAEQYINRALEIHRDPQTLDYGGIFFFNQGQNDRALQLFREALERNPNSTEGRIHYAQALNLAGDHEAAMRHLAAVLSSAPTHSEALHQVANVHGLRGEHRQAAQYLQESIQYTTDQEDLATLYFELGNQQKDLTQYKEALQSYNEAVQRNPDIGEAQLNLGVIYHIQGDYERAMHHYTLARNLLPNHKLLEDNMRKLERSFHRTGG